MAESPVWKKPSEVMKIHRRRKSVAQRRITTDADKRTSVIYKSPSKAKKRNNPFVCDTLPSKRQNTTNQENHDSSSQSQLFDILDTVDQDQRADNVSARPQEPLRPQPNIGQVISEKAKIQSADLEDNAYRSHFKSQPAVSNTGLLGYGKSFLWNMFNVHDYKFELFSSVEEYRALDKTYENTLHSEEEKCPSAYFPIDWSLKCKLRVVSSRPLGWCTQLRSSEEASGIVSFVQDETSQMESLSDQKKVFQQSCMYWIHPNLPWARLFPRIVDDSKQSISFTPVMSDIVQKSLQTDWEQSFSSAYYQLRAGLCPYFYLCTHQVTVLFYKDKERESSFVALVTPTTRGFRELLENEGISFKLPVGDQQQSPGKTSVEKQVPKAHSETGGNEKSGDCGDQEEEEGDDLLETDDAASGWLESMGLDKKEFPTLDPRKVKLQREGFRVIDHRPESLVYVSGADVQALFNFLLNCRSCVAMSGAQAGIPPTILSPQAFKGATLKSHKVKHTAVKQSDRDGNISHAHIVEITGPIMPNHCRSLVRLFHHTQSADFGAVYNNHDPTIPLNILPTLLKCSSCVHNRKSKNLELPVSEQTSFDSRQDGNQTCVDSENVTNCNCDKKTCVGNARDRFFHHVPISDRLCAIKEFVCTKDGFTFTT